jgi:hypothetical protein
MKNKKYILYVIISFVLGVMATSIFFNQSIKNKPEIFLEKTVLNYPKNVDRSSAQWFMKKNLMGEWENLMFIFGYADDRSVCDFMLGIAKETDPKIEFRCKDVN